MLCRYPSMHRILLLMKFYAKSTINQLIVGELLFLGIWANIHNIFKILPAEYEAGKYVIFFIGINDSQNASEE